MRSGKIMYNEEQKEEYILFKDSNEQTLRTYFKRISDKEREYDKDLAEMNVDEIKDTILSLNIRREETRGHILSLLRGYVSWVVSKKIVKNDDAINAITPESLSSHEVIRSHMLSSPEHLRQILDSVLDYTGYIDRSRRDALIFWLLYCGVKPDDLSKLKKSDLDENNKCVIVSTGYKVKVDDYVISLWKHCESMVSIEKRNSRDKRTNEYMDYNLINTPYLFRPITLNATENDGTCKISFFRNIISKTIEAYNKKREQQIKLPATNIYNSGIFYRLLEIEKDGGIISPELMAESFDVKYVDRTGLLFGTRKWRIDYEDWKVAFEL